MSPARSQTASVVDGPVVRPAAGGTESEDGHGDLKRKVARGAVTSVIGQGATFGLRIVSMLVLARLVTPEHFGLVGMVTAFTGFLGLFRDAGLSQATVQRETITDELTSTLFWINLVIGGGLAVLSAMAAPLIADFYGDPRLMWITVALGTGFIFNGALAQHRALLQRSMRFGVLIVIDIGALLVSTGVGVLMAVAGMGYWALVAMAVGQPIASLCGVWVASGWLPGLPRRNVGARSMMQYGGVVTLNSLVVYLAYNIDKVLLGRFWGAEALGVYGRAYQLISLPTESLHTAIAWVMFPALCRVQNDPPRLRTYFLKGYGLFLSVVMPITVACALFSEEIVRVLLGPQWGEAVPIFRLLAPTILTLALISPMGYLMQASGRQVRSLKVAFLIAPVTVLGYALGLPYGPTGVALGFSVAMLLLVVPVVLWAKHGTMITASDLLRTVLPPFISAVAGAGAAYAVGQALGTDDALLRLTVLTTVLFAIHALTLVFVFKQKKAYAEMLRSLGIWPARPRSDKSAV